MSATVRDAHLLPISAKILSVEFGNSVGGKDVRITSVTGLPTVTVDGSEVTVSRVLWQDNGTRWPYPSNVFVLLAAAVPAGATVLLSATEGWVGTDAGTVGDVVDYAVTNHAGGSLLPTAPPDSRTMKASVNLSDFGAYYSGWGCVYADLTKGATYLSAGPSSVDANGYPLAGFVTRIVCRAGGGYKDGTTPLKDGDDAPPGLYALVYKCASEWTLTGFAPWEGVGGRGSTYDEVTSDHQAAVDAFQAARPGWKVRLFQVDCDPDLANGPILAVERSSGAAAVEGWGLYGPGVVDPEDPVACLYDPPTFHPYWVEALTGFGSIRFMGSITVNNSPIVDRSDFADPAWSTYAVWPMRDKLAYIADVVTDDSGFWPDDYFKFKVTTSAPHGLKEGQWTSSSGTFGKAVIHMSDGQDSDCVGWGHPVHVISATQFSIGVPASMFPAQTVTGFTLAGDSNVAINPGSLAPGIPVEDAIELCNLAGANLYLCLPLSMTDAAVDSVNALVAADLRADLKYLCEPTNEPWNPGLGFTQRLLANGKGHDLGIVPGWMLADGQYSPAAPQYAYVCYFADKAFQSARAAFVAEGRDPSDVVRIIGTQAAWTQPTHNLGRYCAENSIAFDRLGVAFYYGAPQWAMVGFDYATLTLDEVEDLNQGNVQALRRYWADQTQAHLDALAEHGITGVEVMNYECALAYNGFADDPELQADQSVACHYHPRHYETQLGYFKAFEDAGIVESCLFGFTAARYNEGPNSRAPNFLMYETVRQQAGRGAGNLALVTDGSGYPKMPDDLSDLESVVAQAMNDWARGVDPAPDPAPTTRPRRRGHRPLWRH